MENFGEDAAETTTDDKTALSVRCVVMSLLANKDYRRTVAYITDAPWREIPHNKKISTILDYLESQHQLDDLLDAAEGKPKYIHYGITELITHALDLEHIRTNVLEDEPEVLYSEKTWLKSFSHLYNDIIAKRTPRADDRPPAPHEHILHARAKENLKKGFSDYFYGHSLDALEQGQTAGFRVVMDVMRKFKSLIDTQDDIAHAKKVDIIPSIEEAVIKHMEALISHDLPMNLAACYSDQVTPQGLFVYAREAMRQFLKEEAAIYPTEPAEGEVPPFLSQHMNDMELLKLADRVFATPQQKAL